MKTCGKRLPGSADWYTKPLETGDTLGYYISLHKQTGRGFKQRKDHSIAVADNSNRFFGRWG